MGNEQTILRTRGFVTEDETKPAFVATKGNEKFLIKKVNLKEKPENVGRAFCTEMEILMETSHPHIVNSKNSFKDGKIFYVVMDYCQGGSLADKVQQSTPYSESEVLSWIVEICMALKTVHEKGLFHKNLMPKEICLTEFGTVCLGGFGKLHETSTINTHYLPPEVFSEGSYDDKSDIWAVGCILYELCVGKPAFSAESTIKLIPKITAGPYPALPENFSPQLRDLLSDIFNKDPRSRPTTTEIMGHPIIISCLTNKCKETVEDLQKKLQMLRDMADGLESVHQGTTIGSLTGGVIGAVGGITSIVGLILAPFTLGTSLIVTGVGIGVGVAGGVTAGASNITNMVRQSSDHKATQSIIKEFDEKINAVVIWLQEISNGLQILRSRCDSVDFEVRDFDQENLVKVGVRAGRGLGGIAELLRLVRVINIGKLAGQVSRVVRVAEVATGVLSGLFVAADIFFIAMDAREIQHIRQAQAHGERNTLVAEAKSNDLMATSDQSELLPNSLMQEVEFDLSETRDQAPPNTPEIKSEVMKFVRSIRQTADKLQKVLDELKSIILSIPSFGAQGEQEWQDMELM